MKAWELGPWATDDPYGGMCVGIMWLSSINTFAGEACVVQGGGTLVGGGSAPIVVEFSETPLAGRFPCVFVTLPAVVFVRNLVLLAGGSALIVSVGRRAILSVCVVALIVVSLS